MVSSWVGVTNTERYVNIDVNNILNNNDTFGGSAGKFSNWKQIKIT